MLCPYCGAQDTKVVDSRLSGDGAQVRRRRECLECGERFTTYETAEVFAPRIVKSDGSREAFLPDKLMAGITRALEKRPVSTGEVDKAINRIRHKLMASGEREIPSRLVGDLVMEELRKLDQVAYVRFASVYRKFDDVGAFLEAIEVLEQQLGPEGQRRQIDIFEDDGG